MAHISLGSGSSHRLGQTAKFLWNASDYFSLNKENTVGLSMFGGNRGSLSDKNSALIVTRDAETLRLIFDPTIFIKNCASPADGFYY